MTVRLIHTADWQLGMTRHFLEGEAQARFSQARLDAIGRDRDLAARASCAEFVVVSGDVFETNQVTRQTVLRACDALRRDRRAGLPSPGQPRPARRGERLPPAGVPRPEAGPRARPRLRRATPVRPGARGGRRAVVQQAPALGPRRATRPPPLAPARASHGCWWATARRTTSMDFAGPAAIRVATAEAALADGRIAYLALGDRHSTTTWARPAGSGTPVARAHRLRRARQRQRPPRGDRRDGAGTARPRPCTVTTIATGTLAVPPPPRGARGRRRPGRPRALVRRPARPGPDDRQAHPRRDADDPRERASRGDAGAGGDPPRARWSNGNATGPRVSSPTTPTSRTLTSPAFARVALDRLRTRAAGDGDGPRPRATPWACSCASREGTADGRHVLDAGGHGLMGALRLRRLRLRDYRGVEDRRSTSRRPASRSSSAPTRREVEPRGSARHRARRARPDEQGVGPRVKPVHRDAGPEVEVDLTAGPYDLTLRKRF